MKKQNIILLKDQGFCYGVTHAIKLAIEACNNEDIKKPIYLLGDIVHNEHITKYFDELGIITVKGTSRIEMINQIPDNSTLIFSAHGVSEKVRQRASEKKLHIIDATCPYVEMTFKKMETACNEGYDVLFIGKENHPEVEAALELSNKVHLVSKDFDKTIQNNKIIVANQTTMSKYDIESTLSKIKEIYPNVEVLDMVCKVTEKRQLGLRELAGTTMEGKSLIIIIGDKKSNNSTKLYELAKRCESYDSIFIESINDLNLDDIRIYDNIIIGSGTSTPYSLINEVKEVLEDLPNIKENKITSKNNFIL